MTKETKIGLLVGLAFIIVIGILLSDHFTSTTAPLQASTVTPMDSVNTPESRSVTRPNVDTTLRNAPDVPVEIVPPAGTPPANHSTVVITPPAATQDRMTIIPPAAEPAPEPRHAGDALINQVPEALRPHVEIPRGPIVSETPGRAREPAADDHEDPLPAVAARQYKVQDGDTVSKIARKLLGSDSPANLKLIAEANGMKDLHRIKIGQTLNVPAAIPAALAPAPTESPAAAGLVAQAGSNDSAVMYTVKLGDTLSRIAVEQCGDPAALQRIRDLNRGLIKNDRIIANMKLKLPPKQVATTLQ